MDCGFHVPTAERHSSPAVSYNDLWTDQNYFGLYFSSYFPFPEHKIKQKDENAPYMFNKRLIFDLLRMDLKEAILVVQAVEMVDKE